MFFPFFISEVHRFSRWVRGVYCNIKDCMYSCNRANKGNYQAWDDVIEDVKDYFLELIEDYIWPFK